MFGNFDQTFGIPVLEPMDPQAALFGANMPPPGAQGPGQGPGLNLPGAPAAAPAAGVTPPAAGMPEKPAGPALGAPSALGGGVLSPGAGAAPAPLGDTQPTAPAAGVGSPLGKVSV